MMRIKSWTKKHHLSALMVTLSNFSSPAFSYNLPHALTHGHGVLQLGAYWNTQGSAQHIDLNELAGDNYSAPKPLNPGSGLVGVGYFIDGINKASFSTAYGINWFYLGPTTRSGTVTQEDLYPNLSYAYKVTNYPLYATAQSTFNPFSSRYGISVQAGVGPNFMTTSHYTEQSIAANTLTDQIFSGTTTTVFSATAGISVKINQVLGQSPLECGYRFFYLGKGQFKTLSAQVQTRLNTGVGYANAVMCSFRV